MTARLAGTHRGGIAWAPLRRGLRRGRAGSLGQDIDVSRAGDADAELKLGAVSSPEDLGLDAHAPRIAAARSAPTPRHNETDSAI